MKMDSANSRIQDAITRKSSFLNLSGLELTEIPPDLCKLEDLEIIDLSNNLITDLSLLHSLKNIRIIDVRQNKITHLKREIFEPGLPIKFENGYKGDGIYLSGNPIISPPIEIITQGQEAIKYYLNAMKSHESKVEMFNEVKVMVLGHAGVGKTSLVGLLFKGENDIRNSERSTLGIEINTTEFHYGDFSVKANVWDFGGQQIFHSTYQPFLTPQTLYILVIDSRQDDNIEHWINAIITEAGLVPIIIVINKIDQGHILSIDERGIRAYYPNIVAFNRVSCTTKEGLPELYEEIKSNLLNSTSPARLIPSSWLTVKKRLEGLNLDYIEYSQFQNICYEFAIVDYDAQNSLSMFLHYQGFINHYRNLPLFSTLILNPRWIANAASVIIYSRLAMDNNGYIHLKEIVSLFTPLSDKYPEKKLKFIVDLMIEFEMLFEVSENTFVIPQMLPIQAPEIDFPKNESLNFFFSYYFLPSNLFSRILVRVQKFIHADYIWRNGIILTKETSRAILSVDSFAKKISIQCVGDQKKELLYILRDMITKINQSYREIKVSEFVSIDVEAGEIELDFNKLRSQGQKIQDIEPVNDEKTVEAGTVINAFEPTNKNQLSPIRIYISYAPKDDSFREELIGHLSPLVRKNEAVIWEKSQIIPGQIWESETMLKLREADLVLCLISSDFIKSEFCYSTELEEALQSHLRKEKVVIPILIRKCYWEYLPIAEIKGIPEPPVSSQTNVDEAWVEVVAGVHRSLNQIREIKYGA